MYRRTASLANNFGYYVGMDEVKRYYLDGNPFGAKGTMNCHPVATIRVEEAEDGQTMLCQWYNASYETRMVNGVLTPLWVCEKGNADLVKEADSWKIWHLVAAVDLVSEAGADYSEQDPYPDYAKDLAEFGEPTIKQLIHDGTFNWWDDYPSMPEPYETWSDDISYGPEGWKAPRQKHYGAREGRNYK